MKLICILCPQGCEIDIDGDNKTIGNRCPRGAAYAIEEKKAPKRTLTTTLAVKGGNRKRVSVKTKETIQLLDQERILSCLSNLHVDAPLHVGDLLSNLGNSSVDFLVTSEVEKA